jgi:hypothetical protein
LIGDIIGRTTITSKTINDTVDLNMGESYKVSTSSIVTRVPVEDKEVTETKKEPFGGVKVYPSSPTPKEDVISVKSYIKVDKVTIKSKIVNNNEEDVDVVLKYPLYSGYVDSSTCPYELKNRDVEFIVNVKKSSTYTFECSFNVVR